MTPIPTPLAGAHLFSMPAFADARGLFVKTFQRSWFEKAGLPFVLHESYYSLSAKGVIRGMHFQLPPHQHAKIVFCPQGAILDVVVDLRTGSPTYGQHFSQELSAENHLALYIPEGFAHGFRALTDGAMTYYLVSSEHAPYADAGVRWDSLGFDWGLSDPVVSPRDAGFPLLSEFQTPF